MKPWRPPPPPDIPASFQTFADVEAHIEAFEAWGRACDDSYARWERALDRRLHRLVVLNNVLSTVVPVVLLALVLWTYTQHRLGLAAWNLVLLAWTLWSSRHFAQKAAALDAARDDANRLTRLDDEVP